MKYGVELLLKIVIGFESLKISSQDDLQVEKLLGHSFSFFFLVFKSNEKN